MTPPITPENVTRTVLDNGTIVLVKENHTNASVTLRGRMRAGAMFEAASLSGLAQFTASSLQRGTEKYTFQKLNDLYDRVGMSFSVSANTETASFGGRALTEDLDQLLGVAEQVLLQPTFPVKEIEKLRGQFITGSREAEQETRYVAFRRLRQFVYPRAHPFHRLSDGTERTLKQISRTQLARFHAAYYRPEGTIIVLVGDVDATAAIEKLQKHFGASRGRGKAPAFEIPTPVLPSVSAWESIGLKGKTQSDVVMGYPGIKRSNPDFYALRTSDLILGQLGLSGRLGAVVRDQMGLCYYVYSSLDAGIGAGPWMIGTGVNPKNTERAIEAINVQVKKFREGGVTQEELEHAQDFLTGSLALRLETNDGVASTLTDIEMYGLGLDYIQRYASIFRGLTLDQIHAALERHAHWDRAVTVIAGPKDERG